VKVMATSFELAHRRLARLHHIYHALHERVRLACPRPGEHHQVGVEVVGDDIARLLILKGKRFSHKK